MVQTAQLVDQVLILNEFVARQEAALAVIDKTGLHSDNLDHEDVADPGFGHEKELRVEIGQESNVEIGRFPLLQ